MKSILGGLAPSVFLRDHWQKRPLLVRQAFPRFAGIVGRDRFLRLATRDDARSRLIIQHPRRRSAARWERHNGPFGGLEIGMLPKSHWTLLVNGVESLIPGGWEILGAFSAIPAARVDDLMVSYAADGGSVGPHDDLYDVFLLQGPGRRRWQISTQRDRSVDPDAAIKVLKAFVAEEEWLLEPGDMLYLPPGVAHSGVADGPGFTYSIGFLAPTHGELIQSFLEYLGAARAAEAAPDARYEDPDLIAQPDRLEVSATMIEKVASVLDGVRWDRGDLADFLGRYLTRPKPRQRFGPPRRPMPEEAFARQLRTRHGGARGGGSGAPARLTLALPSRGLAHRGRIFLNGEAHLPRRATSRLFRQMVTDRSLPLPCPTPLDDEALSLLYGWYTAGYLRLAKG